MTMQLIGVEDLKKVLEDFAPKHANNLMRTTIHGVAGEIQKEAKSRVKERTGNLRRSLKTRRRRGKPSQPASEVYADQRANARYNGFYWRFVEFGTQTSPEQPFMRPARQNVFTNLPAILQKQFKDKLIKAVDREKKKRAKKA